MDQLEDERSGHSAVSRRRFLGAAGATGAASVLSSVGSESVLPASAQGSPHADHHFFDRFSDPPREVRAKFRWWWPHGLVDRKEIADEIDQIADAGFGGVEISDTHHSVSKPLDPKGHGWGTEKWVKAVEAALTRAKERGVVVDITIGPAWPAAVPTVSPQSDAAMKELAHGMATVKAGETFRGDVPRPVVKPAKGVKKQTLHAVQVARLDEQDEVDDPPHKLRASSVEDVTKSVENQRLEWQAPNDGDRWTVISYWIRGSGQRPEAGPHTAPVSYVVDHFSRRGVQAVIDFWEHKILTGRLRSLLKETGGAMFEDSLELESDATLWTPDLPTEFKRRKGYSLEPYLPVVVEKNEDPVFGFDSTTNRQVRDDLNDVRGQLHIEQHLQPLRKWLHGLGLKLRVQPYGLDTDAVAASGVLDIPEGETLSFNLHDFRSLAAGRDLGENKILSSEAAAFLNEAYSETWQKAVRTISQEYAAGVNQVVLHGFSYADAPGAKWPGFAAFTPYHGGVGYSNSWGPVNPPGDMRKTWLASWRDRSWFYRQESRRWTSLFCGSTVMQAVVWELRGSSRTVCIKGGPTSFPAHAYWS